MDLSNKVAVITGAGDGLGKATAIELANQGCQLALIGKTETKLAKVANACEPNVKYYLCDIRYKEQIKQTTQQIVTDFDQIDILINNAGVYFEGDFSGETDDQSQAMIDTNLTGLITITKQVLPHLLSQKSGQIINVCSVAGIEPAEEWAVYAATKHGVTGFTNSLKRELEKHNIKVMAIYPGLMNTNIIKAAGYNYPIEGRSMESEDVAKIITFMLSQPDNLIMDHIELRPFNI